MYMFLIPLYMLNLGFLDQYVSKFLKFTNWLQKDSEHCGSPVWEVGRCETTTKKWNPVVSA